MHLLISIVKKAACLILLFPVAVLLSGLFGALHNQISFIVSPEYFTLFKFQQFGIDSNRLERLGAANVGFQAAWWMGIPIASTLGTIAFFAPDARTMFREAFRAFLLVVAVTLLAGLIGLLWGRTAFVLLSSATPAGWFVPQGIRNLSAYLCAGAMHNASYAGAVIGLLIGAMRLAKSVSRLRQAGSAREEASKASRRKGHVCPFRET